MSGPLENVFSKNKNYDENAQLANHGPRKDFSTFTDAEPRSLPRFTLGS
jgi:hypothetical protein